MTRVLAECRDYPELIAAFRARVAELNVSTECLDAAAGLPERYMAKLLTSKALVRDLRGGGNRAFGRVSLGPFLALMRLKIVVVEDEAPTTKRTLAKRTNLGPRFHACDGMPALKKHRHSGLFTSETGKAMNAARLIVTTSVDRRQWARIAAKARWAKLRKELGTSCA